jgi:hypothetical protein
MNKIILKHSEIAGRIPATTDLELGEVAVNTTDGSLFLKKSSGEIVEFMPVPNSTLERLNFYLFTFLSITWSVLTVALIVYCLIEKFK